MDLQGELERAAAELEPGGRLVASRPFAGGVSADVVGIEVATTGDTRRRAVFRRHRAVGFKPGREDVAAREFAVLRALTGSGLAVPRPYLCSTDGDGPYLVTEWVDGTTELTDAELPDTLDQLAAFLADLHALDVPSLALPELSQVTDPVGGVLPHLPATPVGDRVRAALTGGDPPAVGHRDPVLLHGDYWTGNVLWDDGRLAAVVDWEDAALGDPLADLATARAELFAQYGTDAMLAFTTAYLDRTQPAREPHDLRLWDLYVSATALATMTEWGLPPRDEARRRMRTERFFEAAATGLPQAWA